MGIAEQDLSSSAKFSKLDWPPTKLSIRPAATSRKPVREIASAGLAWRLQLQRRLHRRLHACRAGPHGGLRRHADAALIALPFTKCLGADGEKCSTVPRVNINGRQVPALSGAVAKSAGDGMRCRRHEEETSP